jgi:hypothetical protein
MLLVSDFPNTPKDKICLFSFNSEGKPQLKFYKHIETIIKNIKYHKIHSVYFMCLPIQLYSPSKIDIEDILSVKHIPGKWVAVMRDLEEPDDKDENVCRTLENRELVNPIISRHLASEFLQRIAEYNNSFIALYFVPRDRDSVSLCSFLEALCHIKMIQRNAEHPEELEEIFLSMLKEKVSPFSLDYNLLENDILEEKESAEVLIHLEKLYYS